MKIVYTNLQENDSGIKRSVRQFQVDFGKDSRRRTSLEEGSRDEDRGRRENVLFDREWPPSRGGTVGDGSHSRQADDGRAAPQGLVAQCPIPRGLPVAASLDAFYVRKFIETQMQTTGSACEKNRINILV
jgi:hypothetical protein